jgi:hypothetical protein
MKNGLALIPLLIVATITSVVIYLVFYILPEVSLQKESMSSVSKKGDVGEVVTLPVETSPPYIIEFLKKHAKTTPEPSTDPTPTPTPITTPDVVTPTPVIEPMIITKTVTVSDYTEEAKLRESEIEAEKAATCRKITDIYNNCVDSFNQQMEDYATCIVKSNEQMETYNEQIDQYSKCVSDYNDDMQNYSDCMNPSSYKHQTYCTKPFSSLCHKPLPYYASSCSKPNNLCAKPYCY